MRFFLPALNCFIPHGLHSFSIVIGYRQSICIGYGYGTTELLSVIFAIVSSSSFLLFVRDLKKGICDLLFFLS